MKFANQFVLFFAFVMGVVVSIGLAQEQTQPAASNSPSGASQTAQEDDKKLTIKDIMKEAHDAKKGLAKKVATNKATDKEKKRLQTLYEEMAKLSPPKGTAEQWKEKTDKLVEAAKLAVAGDPTAPKKLKTATNCKSCHKVHK